MHPDHQNATHQQLAYGGQRDEPGGTFADVEHGDAITPSYLYG